MIRQVEYFEKPGSPNTARCLEIVSGLVDEGFPHPLVNPFIPAAYQKYAPLIQQKLSELEETIQLRDQKGFAAAQQLVLTNRGERLADGATPDDAEFGLRHGAASYSWAIGCVPTSG